MLFQLSLFACNILIKNVKSLAFFGQHQFFEFLALFWNQKHKKSFLLIFSCIFLQNLFFSLRRFLCIASDVKLCFASVELFLLMVIILFYVLIIFHISEMLVLF